MSVLLWVVLAVGLGVIEIVSVTFFPIFFAVSAVLALVVALLGGPDWLQWLVFGGGGLIFSGLLRPIAKRQLADGPVLKSRIEQLVGRRVIVTQAIDGRAGTGAVQVDGQTWSARPDEEFGHIPEGADVEIQEVKGATLVVRLAGTEVL